MSGGFDPDAFLAATPEPSGGFDPDAFIGNAVDLTDEERKKFATIGEKSTAEKVLSRILATTNAASQSLTPQVAGLLHAADEKGGFSVDAYRKARDAAKKTTASAEEEAGLPYSVLGAVLGGGLAAPESIAGRLALSGGLGAVNAAANSEADATKLAEGDNAAQFLKDTALGAGTGLVAGGIGEAVGAGINKATKYLGDLKAGAIASQTAKDEAAVAKEIASLRGQVGSETQQGSRMLENIQRAATGAAELGEGGSGAVGREMQAKALGALESPENQRLAEKVLANNLEALPGKTARIETLEAELAAKQANAAKEAAQRTSDYFNAPIFQAEVVPRLKTLAPRFGLAALAQVGGAAYSEVTGDTSKGSAIGGAGIGAILGAPGVRQMMKNIAASPRVQVAIASKLTPLLEGFARAAASGLVPTTSMLAAHVLHEKDLGDPDLAAEKLTAAGGLKSILAATPPSIDHLADTHAPQTPLDQAIQQTASIATLAAALHEHDVEIDRHIAQVLRGEKDAHSTAAVVTTKQDFGARRSRQDADESHRRRVDEAAQLVAEPETLIERIANNTGSLAHVAPGVTGALARTGQRAAQYLAKTGAAPPPPGPMATPRMPSDADKHAFNVASEVVQDPMSVLRHAKAGTLTPERMAALQAVYPTLARQVADVALSKMAENPKAVPYRAKLMLSMMTGLDADGTLATTARNQAVIHAESKKPSNGGAPSGRAPSKGADKLSLAERTALPGTSRETQKAAP